MNLTLPFVAAEAQANRAETQSTLTVRGYVGKGLADLIPGLQSFTIDSYVQMMQAVTKIQGLIGSDEENVRPTVLFVPDLDAGRKEETDQALGLLWALTSLADGRSRLDAKRSFPMQSNGSALATIEGTYVEAMGNADPNDRPDDGSQDWAAGQLGRLRLRD